MAPWRSMAAEMLPELMEEIAEASTPMYLWCCGIGYAFHRAYEEPRNEDLIRRIYAFADWCLVQEGTEDAATDLGTCVLVAFYEHIPTNPAARDDMPRWFTLADVELMKETFSYLIGESEYEALKASFPAPSWRKAAKRQKKKGKRDEG